MDYIIAKGKKYGTILKLKFYIEKGKTAIKILEGSEDKHGIIAKDLIDNLDVCAYGADFGRPCLCYPKNTLGYIQACLKNNYFEDSNYKIQVCGKIESLADIYKKESKDGWIF